MQNGFDRNRSAQAPVCASRVHLALLAFGQCAWHRAADRCVRSSGRREEERAERLDESRSPLASRPSPPSGRRSRSDAHLESTLLPNGFCIAAVGSSWHARAGLVDHGCVKVSDKRAYRGGWFVRTCRTRVIRLRPKRDPVHPDSRRSGRTLVSVHPSLSAAGPGSPCRRGWVWLDPVGLGGFVGAGPERSCASSGCPAFRL